MLLSAGAVVLGGSAAPCFGGVAGAVYWATALPRKPADSITAASELNCFHLVMRISFAGGTRSLASLPRLAMSNRRATLHALAAPRKTPLPRSRRGAMAESFFPCRAIFSTLRRIPDPTTELTWAYGSDGTRYPP